MKILVFDIGGTNIRFGLANGKKVGTPMLRPVPKKYEQALALIRATARSWHADSIAGGLPGPLNRAHTKLIQSTHLPSWVNREFVRDLRRATGCTVWLENDSALVGLGEAVYGAGRGYRIVASIGFGTGIGGARIVDQQIDANAKGFEPGHQIVDWNIVRHSHPSAHPGDWESFVSGTGVLAQTGQPSELIRSAKLWKRVEERAAIGLINVSMFWSPDVIVLSGSLMKKMSLPHIRSAFRQRMKIFPQPPILKRATLGDFSGLYGALALAKSASHYGARG